MQDLERELAIELGIISAEHHSHRAGADLIEQHVATDRSSAAQQRSVEGLGAVEPEGVLDARRTQVEGQAGPLVVRAIITHREVGMPQLRRRPQCDGCAWAIRHLFSGDHRGADVNHDDNPSGLPSVPPPPANPHANPFAPGPAPPQPPNPFANPNNAGSYAPPPASPPSGQGVDPYAPLSVGAQGPAWAPGFGLTQPLANPGTRLVAWMIDGMLYFGVILVMELLDAPLGDDAAGGLGVLGLLGLAIYQWYLLSMTGQTLGKKWMRVRVVKLDGSPVDFASAVVLRSWVPYGLTFVGSLIVVGSVLPLVDALMIFGDERRCLHDLIAGTKVVVAG